VLERWLSNISRRLETIENHIVNDRSRVMAAIDDLKAAVDGAVAEMQAAADFIKNHPATSNDAELADFAQRLQAAAEALHGVDQPSGP
jgi:hypothetical protein